MSGKVRGSADMNSTESTRPIFFFDIDNCVRWASYELYRYVADPFLAVSTK